MKDIRVGIVGYGWAAGAHIESFNMIPGCQVTAVCTSRQLDEGELSRKHGSAIRVYNDYGEMLANPDINLVSICSRNNQHEDQAVAGAEAKKDLVIEKPVALSLDGLSRIEQAVKAAGVKATICFEVRAIGSFRTTRDFIDRGLLGDIHYAEVDYYHGVGPWYRLYQWVIKKDDGKSSLLSAGCHAMDGLLYLTGKKPVEMMTYGAKSTSPHFTPYEYPSTTTTIMKFEDGTVGKVASSIDCLQPYLFNVHLCGSKGTVWNDKFYTEALSGLEEHAWSTFNTNLPDSGDVSHHPYREMFEDLIGAIRGESEQVHKFEDMMYSHRACIAGDMALERGKPVKMAEVE